MRRTRPLIAPVMIAMLLTVAPVAAAAGQGGTVCTWGGTPAAATGAFTMHPGLSNTPSTGPIHFVATGDLAGDAGCSGTLTFTGVLATGATCAAQQLSGRVSGLPG